jgi:hypothetical protein
MYHYHNKTHNPISEGQLCEQGCGNIALFRNTGGKYTCCKITQQCTAYIEKHSKRIVEHWKRPESVYRKEATKKSLIDRLHNNETVKKATLTKRKKSGIISPETIKEYKHYARKIRKKAQQWAKDQGYILGQQTYHVDHRFSILDSWNAGLSEEIVNHPANLRILEAKINSSKGAKSSITLEELMKSIALQLNQLVYGVDRSKS